jgi:hypothetical protein
MGDIRQGVAAYRKAVQLNPKLKEGWINLGQALKEEVGGVQGSNLGQALKAGVQGLNLGQAGRQEVGG